MNGRKNEEEEAKRCRNTCEEWSSRALPCACRGGPTFVLPDF